MIIFNFKKKFRGFFMKNILKRKIGIAGCGTMGLPMLKILLKNKISATGYDVKPKANFKSIKNNFVESKLSFFINTFESNATSSTDLPNTPI